MPSAARTVMSQALLSLVTLTLVVCAAVVSLPELARDRSPRQRPLLAPDISEAQLWIVAAPAGRWFLNGEPLPRRQLAVQLRRHPQAAVHLLPAAGLNVAEVGAALRWLRGFGSRPVQLDMGPAS